MTPEDQQRADVINRILSEARHELAMLDAVINNPRNKRSALDKDGKRRPMYWFANRRSELKRKWNI
jgi:hypothetical protein